MTTEIYKNPIVLIESPYAGDIERNIKYARLCMKHSLLLGESPMLSHLLYTQDGVLDDGIPIEREIGINAGLEFLRVCDKHIFYLDLGMSRGMRCAYELSIINPKINTELRILPEHFIQLLNKTI